MNYIVAIGLKVENIDSGLLSFGQGINFLCFSCAFGVRTYYRMS